MDTTQLKPIVEAMIFVAEEPLSETQMLMALAEDGIEKQMLRDCVALIEKEWNEDVNRGIGLVQVAGGYQFRTKPDASNWIRRLNVPKPMKLTGPSLETLAIVAYRQPIVRSEIEKIRGVDSGGVLKTLLERKLIRIVGRQDEPGQPLLYGSTKEFLEVFNLKALADLPTLKDIEELMRERKTATESQAAVVQAADPEELTEIINDDEEEKTELIKKAPEVEEDAERKKEIDKEALSELEQSLKSLRRLEKSIFPNIPGFKEAADPKGDDDAAELLAGPQNASQHEAEPSDEGFQAEPVESVADETLKDDSSF